MRRGHRPILAGRSREKLDPLGQRLGLEVVAVDLKDWSALRTEVSRVSAVVHAAGPFVHTAEPMRRACLEAGAHYLDITGEIAVFQGSFALDKEAKKRNVAIISGVGFDVVPTDCLSKYVADKLPGAKELEIAFAALGGQTSAGTTKSMLEHAPHGNFVRRAGKLVRVPYGKGAKRVRFSQREAWAMPIPWGDLETAFRTTGIPNITTYIAVSSRVGKTMSLAWPVANAAVWAGGRVLARKSILDRAQALVERRVKGPDEAMREQRPLVRLGPRERRRPLRRGLARHPRGLRVHRDRLGERARAGAEGRRLGRDHPCPRVRRGLRARRADDEADGPGVTVRVA